MIKSTDSKAQFYGLVGLLNIAVGVMFYTINITPAPVLANSAPRVQTTVVKPVPATQGLPVRVVIPSLSLDLPVAVGTYNTDDGSWTVDNTKAYYADVSMPINNANGTTMIYGHAQATIFETLPQIQPGAEVIVYTDNGYAFHYTYTTVQEVAPTDVSVFTSNGPPKLVLQTCVGVYSERRALYSFRLVTIDTL